MVVGVVVVMMTVIITAHYGLPRAHVHEADQIPYTEFHPNGTINAESTDRNTCTSLSMIATEIIFTKFSLSPQLLKEVLYRML